MIHIDESNYKDFSHEFVLGGGEKRHMACKYGKPKPGFASLPDTFKIIPDNETASRSRDLKQSKADLLSLFRSKVKKVKDQNGLSYCHAFSAASAIEMTRALQGESYVELSPSFIGNLVTNFQNAGAYIEDDLEVAVKYGCCSTEFVPECSLSRDWYNKRKEETLANAALHKIDNWVNLGYDRGGGSLNDKVRTCLLQRIPVCVALDFMSHAILYLNVEEDGTWVWLNSWGENWSDHGVATIEKRRGSPSAAWVPASCIASIK